MKTRVLTPLMFLVLLGSSTTMMGWSRPRVQEKYCDQCCSDYCECEYSDECYDSCEQPCQEPLCDAYLPAVNPLVSGCNDLYFIGEFIYWTAREDNLGFLRRNQVVDRQATAGGRHGDVFHPDWNMQPGFKAGIGVIFCDEGWDVRAVYTWLRTRSTKESASRPDGTRLTDLGWTYPVLKEFNDDFDLGNLQGGSGSWKHDFNVIDLDLGRSFYVSPCLELRPHFGLKGTWQKQEFDIEYLTETSEEPISSFEVKSFNELDYWGIGVSAGLESVWRIWSCFALLGEFSATALWQRFDADTHVYSKELSNNVHLVFRNDDNTFHSIHPVLEGLVGIRLDWFFCCDNYHLGFDFAWELQYWGDQNQFRGAITDARLGDLSLQGFTFRLKFDF